MVWSTLNGCSTVALCKQSQGTDTSFYYKQMLLLIHEPKPTPSPIKPMLWGSLRGRIPSIAYRRPLGESPQCLHPTLASDSEDEPVEEERLFRSFEERERRGRKWKGHEGRLAPKETLLFSSKMESSVHAGCLSGAWQTMG